MISYLTGKLAESAPSKIVVETGGVGYDVFISSNSYQNLPPINSDVKIYTYQHVREDVLSLYGFISVEERDLFKTLIGISGIGPKVAIGILSGIAIDDFYSAVADQDIKKLSSISGVGKKTAERLVLELKDKIGAMPSVKINVGKAKTADGQISDDVSSALVALGYKPFAAQNAVKKALSDNQDKKLSMEDLMRKALKYV